MVSLMAINKYPITYDNDKSNKFICLFQWLDIKLEISNNTYDTIKRSELYKFIITKYQTIFKQKEYQRIMQVHLLFLFCDVDEIPKKELYMNIKNDYDLLQDGAHIEMLY